LLHNLCHALWNFVCGRGPFSFLWADFMQHVVSGRLTCLWKTDVLEKGDLFEITELHRYESVVSKHLTCLWKTDMLEKGEMFEITELHRYESVVSGCP
jgi:hypothetical protein